MMMPLQGRPLHAHSDGRLFDDRVKKILFHNNIQYTGVLLSSRFPSPYTAAQPWGFVLHTAQEQEDRYIIKLHSIELSKLRERVCSNTGRSGRGGGGAASRINTAHDD